MKNQGRAFARPFFLQSRQYTCYGFRPLGYNCSMDILTWKSRLQDLPLGDIHIHQQVGSTNHEAQLLAQEGAPNLSLVLADFQSAGKGRQGRTWVTSEGKALAFSLIIYPDPGLINQENLGKLSGLAALSVSEALANNYHLPAEIKWPNDVLINGKKVCGILVDLNWTGTNLDFVILGIGINVCQGSVPRDLELEFPAASLEEILGKEISRLDLLIQVLEELIRWYPEIPFDHFITSWQENLAFANQEIVLQSGDKDLDQGKILGISRDGSLILLSGSGEQRTYQSGEIRLRPVDR